MNVEPAELLDGSDSSGVQLSLYRCVESTPGPGGRRGKPVLLLHGASANHRTFLVRLLDRPRRAVFDGLAGYLLARRFDPWLLDWRGSSLVVEPNSTLLAAQPTLFNFNLAAKYDVPRAIRTIKHVTGCRSVSALGFCMGGGVLAEALALGFVSPEDVDCVVLMTLGLFYETSIDGRLKVEERVLEHLRREKVLFVDPRVERSPWAPRLEDLYTSWPGALKSHADPDRNAGATLNPVDDTCNRLSFIYGVPYHHVNLVDEIHGSPSQKAELGDLFGGIPLQMLIHGARNMRQRRATWFDRSPGSDDAFFSPDARGNFRRLNKLTLITGALNRLWHRNSVDLMYEWVTRGDPTYLEQFRKRVLPDYGHQDLLWGRDSLRDVFPKILEGLDVDDASVARK